MTLQPEGPPRRLQVAVHEAGHYVVRAFFDLPPDFARLVGPADAPDGYVATYIGGNRNAASQTAMGSWSESQAQLKEKIAKGVTEDWQAGCMSVAAVSLAGRVAEQILGGEGQPRRYDFDERSSDHWKARHVLSLAFDGHRRQWVRCQRLAWEILGAKWPCVMRIARALSATGALHGAELAALKAAGEHDALSLQVLPDVSGHGRLDFASLPGAL